MSASVRVADRQGFVPERTEAQAPTSTFGQLGGGVYANSRIADIGLSELGRNLYTPGPTDHGQCKQAVNDWVASASGGTQRLGINYYGNYAANGGKQISRDNAIKGDIIQLDDPTDSANYHYGMHTAVVVSHAAGSNTFNVVDSNYQLDDTVRQHNWDPYASARTHGLRVTIWRMGTPDSPTGGGPGPGDGNPGGGAGSTYSAPAVVQRSTGETDIVAVGPNNSLDYYYNAAGNPTFNRLVVAGAGSTYSAPAVVQRSTGETDIVAVGPNNSLDYYYNAAGNPTFNRLVVAG